ncbi:1,4-dihydroxy-2-naphthoate polyprenyltransferase [Gramella sp. AN32]|uniref:1,4-dihydroxy-2-naphthoate octaprenyltransferase n=1 Tax=Christiangramia antarctica TaxID=2058158 RepID=A0ABW5X7J7_9FLAO|nr:1,4-dihydroxy-2-naphthoate polyprenyltransferase [Gramella sp. AN32]MCM4154587.1 1,4-dihydroxy-2-naphthoate octaprenyltransferase [Gramella sp. AN32]
MRRISTWVSAARLRTLPLSISGIFVGSALAAKAGNFNFSIFTLALGTTLGLQILSNFANDYGDGIKGTDNHERVGPQRALQSGLITRKEMLWAIVITVIATLIMAMLLIYASFGSKNIIASVFFFILGLVSIAAAIKYTVGNTAYGYRGMGDIFVFIFFGWVAVYGSYYLYQQDHAWINLLPATAIGLLSAAVLNINNMRDRKSDKNAGKITLVVKLGKEKAKTYHYLLVVGALFFLLIFSAMVSRELNDFLYIFGFIPLIIHIFRVVKNEDPKELDPELKVVALSTFFISILFAVGILL